MSKRPLVLFLSHRQQHCGVHEYGNMIVRELLQSRYYDVRAIDCTNADDALSAVEQSGAVAAIFNWHPVSMPWGFDAATRCPIPTTTTCRIVHRSTLWRSSIRMRRAAGRDHFRGSPRPRLCHRALSASGASALPTQASSLIV